MMTEQRLRWVEEWLRHDVTHWPQACEAVQSIIDEVRRLQQAREDDTVLLGTVAGERDAAIAERDALRTELAEVKSDADESSVFLSQANDDLSEARRVLREASGWLEPEISRGPAIPAWVRMMRDVAAVLAQEDK